MVGWWKLLLAGKKKQNKKTEKLRLMVIGESTFRKGNFLWLLLFKTYRTLESYNYVYICMNENLFVFFSFIFFRIIQRWVYKALQLQSANMR